MLPSVYAELISLNFEGGGGGACCAEASRTAAISTPNINRNTTTITNCFTFARMSFLPFPRIKNKVLSVFTSIFRPGYFLAGQSNIEIKTLSTREWADKTMARRTNGGKTVLPWKQELQRKVKWSCPAPFAVSSALEIGRAHV